MRGKILTALFAVMVLVGLNTGVAAAWTYSLMGSGVCQPDGSYKITWTVNNTTEEEALTIQESSNPSVVPVGTEVPAEKTADFEQLVDGTKTGSYSLTLKGNWEGDLEKQEKSAMVDLKGPCAQPPATPPVTSTQAPTPKPEAKVTKPQPQPQVQAPVGPVNAGGGPRLNVAAILGLTGSVAALGIGARRLLKDNL